MKRLPIYLDIYRNYGERICNNIMTCPIMNINRSWLFFKSRDLSIKNYSYSFIVMSPYYILPYDKDKYQHRDTFSRTSQGSAVSKTKMLILSSKELSTLLMALPYW